MSRSIRNIYGITVTEEGASIDSALSDFGLSNYIRGALQKGLLNLELEQIQEMSGCYLCWPYLIGDEKNDWMLYS